MQTNGKNRDLPESNYNCNHNRNYNHSCNHNHNNTHKQVEGEGKTLPPRFFVCAIEK